MKRQGTTQRGEGRGRGWESGEGRARGEVRRFCPGPGHPFPAHPFNRNPFLVLAYMCASGACVSSSAEGVGGRAPCAAGALLPKEIPQGAERAAPDLPFGTRAYPVRVLIHARPFLEETVGLQCGTCHSSSKMKKRKSMFPETNDVIRHLHLTKNAGIIIII